MAAEKKPIIGIDLGIDPEYLEEVVRQTVCAGIAEALGGKNAVASEIVHEVLNARVDEEVRAGACRRGDEGLAMHDRRELRQAEEGLVAMDELDTCPLCGSSAHVYDDGAGDLDSVPAWIAACDDEDGCGCETAFFNTREEAVDAWNRRAERTCRKVPGRMKYGRRVPKCSECGQSLGDKRWKYCPNCGAKVVNDDVSE